MSRRRPAPRMTLQRRLEVLVAAVTLVLIAAVAVMGFTVVRFRADATRRDRLTIASARPEARAVVRAAVDKGARSRDRFLNSVAAATLTAIVLLIIGSVALRRWVLLPIGRLHRDVDAIADGDIYRAVRPVGARDLMELGGAVERMRTRILRELDALRRAGEAVDQDAPAVASLRRLLAPVETDIPAGFDVAATLLPAEGVLAGDWYDLIRVDDRLVITLGDVCGHGAPTGSDAVRTKFALMDAASLGAEPGAGLELAASRFGDHSDFVTIVVAHVDASAHVCRYANAGHPPPLIVDDRGDVRELELTGPLIGPFPGTWNTQSVPFEPGSTLVLYSDGLTEARDAAGREFGSEPIRRAVAARPGTGADAILAELVAALFRHRPGGLLDDVTIVVVRCTS